MNNWEILGIEPTDDVQIIRKAYAQKSKIYHPETHPEEFQALHNAYRTLIKQLSYKQQLAYIDLDDSGNNVGNITDSDADSSTDAISNRSYGVSDNIQNNIPDNNINNLSDFLSDNDFIDMVEQISSTEYEKKRRLYHIDTLQNLLNNRSNSNDWKRFFTSMDFLDNQYNPEFIDYAAECFYDALKQPIDDNGNYGKCSKFAFIYLIIAYGCIFPDIYSIPIQEKIYKQQLITPYQDAFRLYNNKPIAYSELEKTPQYLGEKFSFYVYHNILEILDQPYVNCDELSQWIAWGLAREHTAHLYDVCHYAAKRTNYNIPGSTCTVDRIIRSPLVFELLAYLLDAPQTPALYRNVLKSVCESFMLNPGCCEEIKILWTLCG